MFRDVALKKGHIKPITAANGSFIGPVRPPVPVVVNAPGMGTMVGSGRTAPQVPALRKQPTFFGRMGTGIKNLGRNIFSIPAIGGYYGGDKIGQALGIESELARMPFGIAGSVAASRALPVLAGLPATLSAALLAGPAYLTIAGTRERERIKKMSPKERAAHTAKVREFGLEGYLDDDQFKKQFEIDPSKLDNIVKKSTKQTTPAVGAGRQTLRKDQKEAIDFATTPGNVTILGKDKVIDTSKIAENVVPSVDSGREGDSASAIARQSALPPSDDAQDKITDDDQTKDPPKDPPKGDADRATIDATSPMADRLKQARAIVKELRAGRGSQANLVFLSNLASGLLTGTTRRKGIGGALEVFGAALGPAVNNMVMVKMKEDEIEQNLMGDALELAFEENKRRNTAAELPDIDKHGVIQIKDQNGNPQNVIGVRYKNGTHGIASGKFDQFNREIFIPITSQEFTKFIDGEKGEAERFKILRDLSGKYKAYQIGETSINLLRKEDVTGGPKGKLDLFVKRTSDALNDLGFTFIGRDGIEAGKRKISELRQDLINEYAFDNDVSVKEAEKIIDKIFKKQFSIKGRDSLLDSTLKRFGVEFKGTGADLEQLAINETILTYALANSLKSKDRLTQKDIEMAAKLVNVFPIGRGEASVIESLEAVNRTLLKDIEASEFDYQFAFGGDTATINEYRKKYGTLKPTQEQFKLPGFADESSEDLIKKYYK
jgi:hypothetical protein